MPLARLSFVDRAKKLMKLLGRRSESTVIRADEKTGGQLFTNAHDLNVNGGNFISEVNARDIINELQINYVNNVVSGKPAVFDLLEPYTCLDATKDSSARYPPPRCHPGTRSKIRERLMRWLLYEYDGWKMLWVRGSAGTGKSAVAQSFGDSCGEEKIPSASYFFSRVAGRNKLETVVPTIVFQLVTTVPEYRSLIGNKLANNPLLLRQSPPVQFRELIVEPFTTLQQERARQPMVIILDGLDECEGEKAQLGILEMITNAIRTNPNLPLRWLILSRPEAHLKSAFSRNLICGREELVIDAECRNDVERYVKDRFVEIQNAYNDVTPGDWPSPDNMEELIDAVSGLFVFASTCLNFIDDPDKANPPSQLNSLLAFMRRSQSVVSRNPLAVLDLLYSQILERITPDVYQTTRRILAYITHRDKVDRIAHLTSAQALSNFLRLDRPAFYGAVRGLYSVAIIPEADDADRAQLRFYHASFQDFLLNPNRSGKFCLSEQDALAVIIPLGVYWLDVDVAHFHTGDGWGDFDYDHKHDCLPDLTWASRANRSKLSESICFFFEDTVIGVTLHLQWDCLDQDFLSHLSRMDFRCWAAVQVRYFVLHCRLDSSTSVMRVEPTSDTDHQLLEYLNVVIGHGIARPAQLPLRRDLPTDEWSREYFFIGHGVKSVIVWSTKSPASGLEYSHLLRSDQEPSQAQISKYATYLQDISWDEARARAEMK